MEEQKIASNADNHTRFIDNSSMSKWEKPINLNVEENEF